MEYTVYAKKLMHEDDIIVAIWKNKRETPLEALHRLRRERSEFKESTLSYAGRLDPLAQGVLPVLVGNQANKNRDHYLRTDKVYELSVLFGIGTDSHDLLGVPAAFSHEINIDKSTAESACLSFTGTYTQKYPGYSSKTIAGKPMHTLMRESKLSQKEKPSQEVTIYSVTINGWEQISARLILQEVNKFSEITGDFRQKEIIERWHEIFKNFPEALFPVLSITVACSSGTYMRKLAYDIGQILKVPALAYSITRIQAGNFTKSDCIL